MATEDGPCRPPVETPAAAPVHGTSAAAAATVRKAAFKSEAIMVVAVEASPATIAEQLVGPSAERTTADEVTAALSSGSLATSPWE